MRCHSFPLFQIVKITDSNLIWLLLEAPIAKSFRCKSKLHGTIGKLQGEVEIEVGVQRSWTSMDLLNMYFETMYPGKSNEISV